MFTKELFPNDQALRKWRPFYITSKFGYPSIFLQRDATIAYVDMPYFSSDYLQFDSSVKCSAINSLRTVGFDLKELFQRPMP